MNIYQENGFKNREDYLNHIAEDYGIPVHEVYAIAEMLGEGEDFDALLTSLEDLLIWEDAFA